MRKDKCQPSLLPYLAHQLIVACIAAIIFINSVLPVVARQKSAAPPFVVIPIFYVTDRDRQGKTFGPNRKYIVDCLHDMYYGVAYVHVPNDKHWMVNQPFEMLGWALADKLPKGPSRKDEIQTDKPGTDKQEFFRRLGKALDRTPDNHLCVFVHGGADPFEDAAEDAAQLAYYMQCPTILYSWPSVGKLKRYRVDEGNAEWSQYHYNTFCQDLEAFSKMHPLTVSLISHSLGNRLVARAAHGLQHTEYLTDVALVSPDIDAETFKHYVAGYKQRDDKLKVRLYVSNKDKVLPFTQMLYGGYYRLGESVGSVMAMLSSQQGVPGNSKSLTTMQQVNGQQKSYEISEQSRLDKIDFTDVDHGFIGHHFPFELVANMSRHNVPGLGLSLASEKLGNGNLFARWAKWRNDLVQDAEKDPGYCKRVVRLKKD